jgi:hypothetical protein
MIFKTHSLTDLYEDEVYFHEVGDEIVSSCTAA